MLVTFILIALLVLVGFVFFKLSKKYSKNKFLYTLLGVFTFILGVALYIVLYAVFIDAVSHINRYIHEFLCFTTGGVFSFLMYRLLEKKWQKLVA